MKPNFLIFMSDEHAPSVCGCYGNPLVQTPALDRLAAQGTVYDRAYTTAPMCVPARMSFLTGQYPGRVNVWDNGSVLGGEHPTYAVYLSAAGYETVLCGRMHMLGADRLHGFQTRLYDDMLDWMNPNQTPRRVPEARRGSNSHVTECGPGEGSWQRYDAASVDLAARYLRAKAAQPSDKPFMLTVGCMFPHFPLIAPPEWYELYQNAPLPLAATRFEAPDMQHPAIAQLRRFFRNDAPVPDELALRALRSYYALVSLIDHYVGRLTEIVDRSPLRENTVILYVSDHGEMAGSHGIWQKQCFYEQAARIPLITRVPERFQGLLPNAGHRSECVSIVDILPTLLEMAGEEPACGLPGVSLAHPLDHRDIFSEYHAQGMLSAGMMLLRDPYKLCYYVNGAPALYNLTDDPDETRDLAGEKAYQGILADLEARLRAVCDPEEMDAAAKRDQEKRLKR